VKITAAQRFVLKGHTHPVYAFSQAASPSHFYSAGGDKLVLEWDLETGTICSAVAKAPASIYSLCYIPETHQLAIGQSAGGLHVIDLTLKKEIHHFTVHRKGIFNLQYDAASQRLFAASADGLLTAWDAGDWSLLANVSVCDEKIRSISVSPSLDRIAVSCSDTFIRILNYTTLAFVNEFKAHDWGVNAVCWHPEKPLLLSGSKDAHLRVWDAADDFRLLSTIPAHNYAIYSIAFHPDGKLFATGSRDKTIKIWDAHSFEFLLRISKEVHNSHTHSVNSLLWHSFQDVLLSGGDDREVMAWDVEKD
jgi:WD40 repeat protein